MTYHDWIWLTLLFATLVIIPCAVLALRSLYPPDIEKRIKSQPNFTADDWLLSTSRGTGVAIDAGRKVLLLADDRASRVYQARELIGCEVLSDDVHLSRPPQAAITLRILVNDVHKPQHDVVLLERSSISASGGRRCRVAAASGIASPWWPTGTAEQLT
jgi:hypothetical protein